MKYNSKYDRWFTRGGLVFRYDEKNDRMVECSIVKVGSKREYCAFKAVNKMNLVHRAIWETFKGEIPEGLCIDHRDTNPENNAIDNLELVTYKENSNNPLTLQHIQEANIRKGKPCSEFGFKFYEKFGLHRRDNKKLYFREHKWYKVHGHCRWEVLDEYN